MPGAHHGRPVSSELGAERRRWRAAGRRGVSMQLPSCPGRLGAWADASDRGKRRGGPAAPAAGWFSHGGRGGEVLFLPVFSLLFLGIIQLSSQNARLKIYTIQRFLVSLEGCAAVPVVQCHRPPRVFTPQKRRGR